MSMNKKGFDFSLEIENVKEDENFENQTFINEIQNLIDTTPFLINNVGFFESTGNLAITGQVCRETKKEAEAEYTIFKAKLLKILRKYYKKIKDIDRMKLYFTTK